MIFTVCDDGESHWIPSLLSLWHGVLLNCFVSQDLLDFKDVNEAFSCLSDPTKRAQYDIKIAPAPANAKPIIHEVTDIVMQAPTKEDKKARDIHY